MLDHRQLTRLQEDRSMPAPLGNKNAESAWFSPVDPEERTVQVAGRIVESQNQAIDKIIKQRKGLTKSAVIREAISLWLKQYQEEKAGDAASG